MITQLLSQGDATLGWLLGGAGLFFIVAALFAITKLLVIGNPSEMLIISGKRQRDGQGYRTLIGGRTLVIPFLEKVSRISLRNMQVSLEVKAQAGGGTMVPILVTGVANVKVSSNPDERANAIERFLDQPSQELQRVARETLEGGLRAVIGKMTPEEIVEDRDKFVQTVMHEVTDDFRKLGLLIDSVNIQNVADEQLYLESIARKATAEVLSSARKTEAAQAAEAAVKEAEADASARQAKAQQDAAAKSTEAGSLQKAEEARLGAEKSIAEANNALRIRKAELAREAAIKEAEQQEAAAKAEEARLNATQVAAANAHRDMAMAKAEGDAASVYEEGKARAAAIQQIGEAISQHPDALKVMLVEMMPNVVKEIATSVNNIAFGEVTVIDGGKGDAVAGAAMGRAKALGETLAIVENIVGVDLRELSKDIAGNLGRRTIESHAPSGSHGDGDGHSQA
ncbi:MAG: flotillin family protein [Planctomycetota bacterium]|jgi:flotillin